MRFALALVIAVLVLTSTADGKKPKRQSTVLTAIPELLFPRNPGISGTDLAEHACGDFNGPVSADCAQDDDFKRSDYEGWGNNNGVNERITWALDPTGSGKTVAQYEVYGDDIPDQFGGSPRATLYEGTASNCNGCSAWFTYAYLIPVGFQYPDQWMILMQNFISPKPVQEIALRQGANCTSAVPPDHICWEERQASGDATTNHDLGPIQEGHWNYIVAHITFSNTATGSYQVWYGVDTLPDVTQIPAVERSNILTLFSGATASRSDVFIYRGSSTHTQHQVVYVCGFHRALDAATSMTLPNCPV
jgi:hypothetical protein